MLGTERHESRRIDNQLRGRSGRQGDPGESRFYLSLGDELMRRFNGQLVESIMNRFNLPDDVPIEAGMVTKAIRSAQTQVEQQNFEIRKNVLKYDEVLNKQRTVIYDERRRVLAGEDIGEQIEHMLGDVVSAYVDGATAEGYAEDWDLDKLWTALGTLYPIGLDRAKLVERRRRRPDPRRGSPRPCSPTRARPTPGVRPRSTPSSAAQGGMRELERQVLLQVMDRKWREHLYEMDYLKEGIGLRAMAQRDPLIEYQREGFDMFAAMLEGIKEETVGHLFNVRVQAAGSRRPPAGEADGGAGEPGRADAADAPAAAAARQIRRPRRTARVPARSANAVGRPACGTRDRPGATGAPARRAERRGPAPAAELQYSGPAEDGGTARSRSGGATAGSAAGAAASRPGTGRARAARAASTSTATGCRRPRGRRSPTADDSLTAAAG